MTNEGGCVTNDYWRTNIKLKLSRQQARHCLEEKYGVKKGSFCKLCVGSTANAVCYQTWKNASQAVYGMKRN
jgi:hypothetical protein